MEVVNMSPQAPFKTLSSRPGAKAEFAETEPMNQFKVGQVVKVKVATGVVEGTVVKRMYDSMTGGERYLVEMPSQSQRGKMEQTAVFPYQIRASRPGAKAEFAAHPSWSEGHRSEARGIFVDQQEQHRNRAQANAAR
jgi:ribosomal protein L21E